nr:immunoglobulin heavy chain junction region [Mus musculus]MBK4189193.1 immunoglobulin heavy chain junction region [Mus musculus]MBK4189194.1 immunoglobulin heavy chain junction region [Mus musculus]
CARWGGGSSLYWYFDVW